jgi:hypothetical protein
MWKPPRIALQDGRLGGLLVVVADLRRLERRAAGERGGHHQDEPQRLRFHEPSSFDQLMAWPTTREQRCWVHKTANVLGKLPKSQQPKAKRALQEIWMAETKADAEAGFDAFIESYQVKYGKAAECLNKDRDALLTFYDFPAEHWKHLRTTNPIESTFATVRHRTIRSKGCLSNCTALAMVFKLIEAAQKNWRRLDGNSQLPKLILGVKFVDGIEVGAKPANRQPTTVAA